MKLPARLLFGLALATSLACAGDPRPASADDKPAPPPPASGEGEKPPPRQQQGASAVVEDQYGVVVEIADPTFVRPASGLIGGGSRGAKLTELHVWRGAHEILIPLAEIVRIEVTGKNEGDLVPVRLTMKGGGTLEGKVERELELHGKVQYGVYQIKFERLRSVAIRA